MLVDVPPRTPDPTRPHTLVRYTGGRRGSFSVTGLKTGIDYRFGADDPLRWVRDEDVPKFGLLGDFVVLHEHHHDPERERLERLIAEKVEERLAAAMPAPKPRRRGGRPRTEKRDTELMWHLRYHADPPSMPWQIAERLLNDANGAKTISQRLWRFRAGQADPLPIESCPFCGDLTDPLLQN